MARTFDQVLAEITAKSDPQRKIVLDQVAALPTQQAADEAGLEAKKTQAFDEILGGARRRGLGFAGIPLGDQAKYAATDYAPAVANLKAGYGQRRGTLESALADIGRNDYTTAYDIFNQDRAFAEQQRQFNEQQAAAKRAAAAQANPFAGLFQGNNSVPSQPNQTPAADPVNQKAYNAVQDLLNTKNAGLIQKTYAAIKDAAGRGSAYDKIKLQLIEQLYPAARNFGRNSVPLGKSTPTTVSLNPVYSGLNVGVANPGTLRVR